jgi:predicted  nucleic acid-binding Zn-ribbon protein
MNKPIHPNFFIPETFGDAVSYEAQVKYLHQRLKTLEEEGIPTPDLAELKQRVTTLETEVTAIQGEIEDLDLESITAHFEQIDADIEQLQATQSQQGTTLQDYNTRILGLETTTDSQAQAIDALDGRVTGVTTAVANVLAEQTQMAQDIAGKQDQLTAGANITIQNNVISASGGGGTIDIDTTVTPNSQHAVTSEGIYNAIQTAKTAVETQHTTDINRIDGELAGKASTASVTTLRGDMEDEIERVEGDYQGADAALDTRLTAVETAQTTTEGNVTTLQQNVNTLEITQRSHTTSIHHIKTRLDTAESNITQLQTDTSQLSGTVQGMQTAIQGKQDKLTAGTNITIQNNVISASGGGSITLDNDVTQNSQNGVKSSGIYTAIQNAKSDMATQDAAIQADLTALTTRVDDVEDDVEQAQTDISTLQTGQQTLTTNLSSETSARETADQALRLDVNANTSAINTLRTNTNASITQLQTDVAGKQDQLTAGANITIENNVISASGGGGTEAIEVNAGNVIYNNRNNTTQAASASTIFYLARTPQTMSLLDNTSGSASFYLPISVSGGTPVFETIYTKTVWMNDLFSQYKEYAGVPSYLGPTGSNPFYTRYMYARDNEWIAYNNTPLSTIDRQVAQMATQGIPDDANNPLLCTNIPLSIRPPKSVTMQQPWVCPPKIMKGYCVWLKDGASNPLAYPIGVMLVELEQIYQAYKTNYTRNSVLSGSYKCVKWIKTINELPTDPANFLITPIF